MKYCCHYSAGRPNGLIDVTAASSVRLQSSQDFSLVVASKLRHNCSLMSSDEANEFRTTEATTAAATVLYEVNQTNVIGVVVIEHAQMNQAI